MIGSVAGGIIANPNIIGTVTGAGVLLKTFCETKNYKRKIEMSKYIQKYIQHIRKYQPMSKLRFEVGPLINRTF